MQYELALIHLFFIYIFCYITFLCMTSLFILDVSSGAVVILKAQSSQVEMEKKEEILRVKILTSPTQIDWICMIISCSQCFLLKLTLLCFYLYPIYGNHPLLHQIKKKRSIVLCCVSSWFLEA